MRLKEAAQDRRIHKARRLGARREAGVQESAAVAALKRKAVLTGRVRVVIASKLLEI